MLESRTKRCAFFGVQAGAKGLIAGVCVRFSNTMTPTSQSTETLEDALRAWWKEEQSDWDRRVSESDSRNLQGGAELWDGMPTIDSKVVAETSPIFERHLGIPLDTSKIKPGGYSGIEELISDLVPKMQRLKRLQTTQTKAGRRDGHEEGT